MSTQQLFMTIAVTFVVLAWGYLLLDVFLGIREQRRLARAAAKSIKSLDKHAEEALRMLIGGRS